MMVETNDNDNNNNNNKGEDEIKIPGTFFSAQMHIDSLKSLYKSGLFTDCTYQSQEIDKKISQTFDSSIEHLCIKHEIDETSRKLNQMPSISKQTKESLLLHRKEEAKLIISCSKGNEEDDGSISTITSLSFIDNRKEDESLSLEGGSFIDHAHSIIHEDTADSIYDVMNDDIHSLETDDSDYSTICSVHNSHTHRSHSNSGNNLDLDINSSRCRISSSDIKSFENFITIGDWCGVHSCLKDQPTYSRIRIKSKKSNDKRLQVPLNVVCHMRAPDYVIQAFVNAWPDALCIKNGKESFPFHEIVKRKYVSRKLVESLFNSNKECIDLLDGDGRLPIQCAYYEGVNHHIIRTLYRFRPEADDLAHFDSGIRFNLHKSTGSLFYKEKQYFRAKVELNYAIEHSEYNRIEVAPLLILLSSVNRKLMEYNEAQKYATEAISMLLKDDEHGENIETGHAYFELGNVEYKLKRYKRSLKCFSYAGSVYSNAGFGDENAVIIQLKTIFIKTYKAYLKQFKPRKMKTITHAQVSKI